MSKSKDRASSQPPGKGRGVEFAYGVLRREIVSLTLRPGSPLDEVALATRLGLSRTPVHEALVRLASEELVVLLPNRGTTVASLEWEHVRELLEALDLSQRVVTRWAAVRCTAPQLALIEEECATFEKWEKAGNVEEMNESNWRFHAFIAAACGNRLVERSYLHLLTLTLRIAYLAYNAEHFASADAYREHMTTVLQEHRATVEAIRNRDADLAEKLGHSHAGLGRKRILDVMSRGISGSLDIALDRSLETPATWTL
jgi:DNA-binding GntR family transcriptional regulator